MELDLAERDVAKVRSTLSVGWSSKRLVRAVATNPPIYVCMLRYDPSIARERAVAAIQAATHSSSLMALWSALNIGHPFLRPAADESGVVRGEIMRGSLSQVFLCISKLQKACPELEATYELAEYKIEDEQNDSCQVS